MGWSAILTSNLQCLGRHDGVNQDGLVMGLHFVSHEGYRKGVSPWLAVRMVLDRCSSVDEAVGMLREIPHAACYNFSMGDRHGKIAVVEAAPRNVMVREDGTFLTCVNHFQEECLGKENRSGIQGSLNRNEYCKRSRISM
nr:C45 family peptidase [Halobacillus trueperi]